MIIVIVEDEIRIREGLSRLVRKISPHYIIYGVAENGKEGIELIEKTRPDLVISDIRMPDMDGLQMLECLKEKGISFHTIILTAYSEFNYAKTAIHLGVSEYLLKPISVEELKKALNKVEMQIEKERSEAMLQPETLGSLEHIFSGLMIQNLKLDQELEKYLKEQYGLGTDEEYTLVPVYLGQEYEICVEKLQRELNVIMESREGLHFQIIRIPAEQLFTFVIYQYQDSAELKRWFQNRILMQLSRDKKYHVSIGWITVQGIGRLQEGLEIIQKYIHWNIILGDNVIISYPQITFVKTVEISYPVELEEQMRQVLCMRNVEKAEHCVQKFKNYYKKDQLFEPKVIKEHYIRFILSILNVASELNFTFFKDLRQQEMIERISKSITEAELTRMLEIVLERVSQEEITEESTTIQKIKGLVHEYYGVGITLGEVSRRLNMTPEYLGTLFRKEEGIHFNTYMKKYRVQKAKEILLGTNLKLYEVAEKVGYTDPKYFSRVFKEVTGYLPAEYRKVKK